MHPAGSLQISAISSGIGKKIHLIMSGSCFCVLIHRATILAKPLALILLLSRSTDWPNWLQYASIPLSPNTDYIWQHWLHCALYMCTSSSPVNLLMDFVGACQGNHRLQHPHPCVPCIVPVKPSTIEHWKPWLVDSAECMASQWIVTSPGLYTCPKLHFSKDKAANLNQVTALCADWKNTLFNIF